MSLLNFYVPADRALVCVDTDVGHSNGGHFESSKALLLPHANALLAARGGMHILEQVFLAAAQNFVTGFDDLAIRMPGWLEAVHKMNSERSRAAGLPDVFGEADVAIFGWSDEDSRMRSRQFSRDPQSGAWVPTHHEWGAAPGEPDGPAIDRPFATPEAMVALAVRQVRWLQACADKEGPSCGPVGGGRLVVVEMTRETTRFARVAL